MKKQIVMIMLATVMFAVGAGAQTWNIGVGADSAKVIATLSGGTLTISGTGAMRDWGTIGGEPSPWTHFSVINILTDVVIEEGVTTIGNDAFRGCTRLTSVSIPNGVITIGYNAFRNCTGLTSIIIPNSVITIGYAAFSGCTGLISVTIGSSVRTIGDSAFSDCTSLTSVTIGNNVRTIEYRAFQNCTGLTSITIPNSVTEIEEQAFIGCTGLTEVIIGNRVTTIGSNAFRDSNRLTSVTSLNPVPPTIGFFNIFNVVATALACLYVPENAIDAYSSAPGWEDFSCINAVTSIATSDRIIPPTLDTAAVVAPIVVTAGEFTIGPNPVDRRSGSVSFYWTGKALSGGTLFVYDASGNVVNRIAIIGNTRADNIRPYDSRRQIGKWDLSDRRGNPISEGTYLIRGTLTMSDGTRERVSVIVGIR